ARNHVAVANDGSRLLLNSGTSGTYVFDGALAYLGAIPNVRWGVAIGPTRAGFRVSQSAVEQVNIETRSVTRTIPLPDTVERAGFRSPFGRVSLSPDGLLLAVITERGIALVRL
ncbi:MAG TPA: hypothetical protein VHH54_01295, partial [Actinomycetota bacterium]|nr:hypothetical protein [Actinomycetota bacterium]